jgi:hypothetical protein
MHITARFVRFAALMQTQGLEKRKDRQTSINLHTQKLFDNTGSYSFRSVYAAEIDPACFCVLCYDQELVRGNLRGIQGVQGNLDNKYINLPYIYISYNILL